MSSTQADVQKVINKLRKLPLEYQNKALKKVLRKNAKPLIVKAKSNIPRAAKPVHRYKDGKIVATYSPGNLRRSIGIIPRLRRTNAVFVGPRTGGKLKSDGYYGHFLELGTAFIQGIHYMENAYKATRNTVVAGITNDVKSILNNFSRKNGIR